MSSRPLNPLEPPTVADSIDHVRREVAAARGRGKKVGLVPTMGALHAGHLSLIEAARAACGYVVATIFVNPTQFGPNEDFTKYPRTLETDVAACAAAGVDLVFVPRDELIYPPGFATYVEVEGISKVLEGKYRPTHFRGVTTVVLKLFNIVDADVAFFGRKDYQQQLLIRTMCRDLNLPIRIETCPTIREEDGLALSSRNRHLDPQARRSALALSQALQLAKNRLEAGATDVAAVQQAMLDLLNSSPGVAVDYATIAHPETLAELSSPLAKMVALVAARVGQTRLIDNMPIQL